MQTHMLRCVWRQRALVHQWATVRVSVMSSQLTLRLVQRGVYPSAGDPMIFAVSVKKFSTIH